MYDLSWIIQETRLDSCSYNGLQSIKRLRQPYCVHVVFVCPCVLGTWAVRMASIRDVLQGSSKVTWESVWESVCTMDQRTDTSHTYTIKWGKYQPWTSEPCRWINTRERKSTAFAMELRLSNTTPSIWKQSKQLLIWVNSLARVDSTRHRKILPTFLQRMSRFFRTPSHNLMQCWFISLMGFCGSHLRLIWLKRVAKYTSLNSIYSILLAHLPWVNELIQYPFLWGDWRPPASWQQTCLWLINFNPSMDK